MGNTILENCGAHTDKLIEIATKVKKQKIFNGEPVTNQTILDIDNDIYEAYQAILSNLKDGGNIAKAIQYLENGLENSSTTANIKQLADAVSQKVINEAENMKFQENIAGNIVAGAVVATALDNTIVEKSNKILDNVFDEKTVKEMDVVLEKAKEGNVDAAAEMEAIKGATRFMGKNLTLEGKNAYVLALGRMQRLAEFDSPAAQEILRKMAEQYREQLDVFEVDENGKEFISKEKISKLLEDRIPEEVARTIDPQKSNRRVGETAVRKGTYTGEKKSQEGIIVSEDENKQLGELDSGKKVPQDSRDVIDDVKRKAEKSNVGKLIAQYSKLEDEEAIKGMRELYDKHPEIVREILKDKIEWCNTFQQSGKGSKVLPGLQRQVMMLSDVIHSKEERALGGESKLVEDKASGSKRVEDDDLTL